MSTDPTTPEAPPPSSPTPTPPRSLASRVLRFFLTAVFLIVVAAGAFVGWVVHATDKKAKPRARAITVPTSPEIVARGRYLAATSCELCHGKDLAGGKEFTLPIVHAFASNVTQDEATGIGKWTDGQIEEALRRGVRPDGRILRPPMPVMERMSDEDLHAVIAYLRTVPPVAKTPPPTALTPLGRFVFAVGKVKPRHGVAAGIAAPSSASPAEFGRYLAEGVFFCADCHHPRVKNVPVEGKLWSGGFRLDEPGLPPVLSANVTPDPIEGIGDWKESELAKAVREGVNPSGRTLHEAMPRYPVSDADAHALWEFLRTVPPVRVHVYSAEALRGSELYKKYGCVSCHGPDGKGPRADVTKLGASKDVAKIKAWIKDPAAVKPGTDMPRTPIADEKDLDALARFVIELSGG